MVDTVRISIVMVDGGFRENFRPIEYWLNQTLPRNQYELIWVDYTDRVATEITALPKVRCFALGRDDEPQVLAYAFNEGIRRARGEIVVLPDADVACEPDLLETVANELTEDHELVLYVLRLDQPKAHFRPDQDLGHLRRTCSIKHTYNYGGCTAVRREWLIKMNGYEQLPFFAAYHYNGGDNYIRFKNMGLKVRWHPTQRVYHPWHPVPPAEKFATAEEQEQFICRRAATWEWLAYEGLDPSRNREYDPKASFPSGWERIVTERGSYIHPSNSLPASLLTHIRQVWRRHGVLKGAVRMCGRLTKRLVELT